MVNSDVSVTNDITRSLLPETLICNLVTAAAFKFTTVPSITFLLGESNVGSTLQSAQAQYSDLGGGAKALNCYAILYDALISKLPPSYKVRKCSIQAI